MMNKNSLIVILILWLVAGVSVTEMRAQGLMQEYGITSNRSKQNKLKFYFVMSGADLVFQYGPNLMQRQLFDSLAKRVAMLEISQIDSIVVNTYTSSTEIRTGSIELAQARIVAVEGYLIRTLEHNELQGVEIITRIRSIDGQESDDTSLEGADMYNKVRRVEFTAYLNPMKGYIPTTPMERQLNVTSELTQQMSDIVSTPQQELQLAAIVTNLYPVWKPGGDKRKQRYEQPVAQTKPKYEPKSHYTGSVNQKFAIRTNIPYWLMIAPNVGVELYMGGRTSLLLEGTLSYWGKKTDPDVGDKGIYIAEIGPEFRYWLSDDRSNSSHFFGVYGQYVDFDIKFSETGKQGTSIGGGVSYGYYLPVGNKWAFEFGIGLGYLSSKVDVYEWNSVQQENTWVENKKTAWIGPTKIKVAIMFRIGNKR